MNKLCTSHLSRPQMTSHLPTLPGEWDGWSQIFLHCTIKDWTKSTQREGVASKRARFCCCYGWSRPCFDLSQCLSAERLSKYLLNWATFVSTPAAYRTVCMFSWNIKIRVQVWNFAETQFKCIQNGLESIIHYCLVNWEENAVLFISGDLKSHPGSSSWNTLARGLLCLGRLWRKPKRATHWARCLGKCLTWAPL